MKILLVCFGFTLSLSAFASDGGHGQETLAYSCNVPEDSAYSLKLYQNLDAFGSSSFYVLKDGKVVDRLFVDRQEQKARANTKYNWFSELTAAVSGEAYRISFKTSSDAYGQPNFGSLLIIRNGNGSIGHSLNCSGFFVRPFFPATAN